LDNGTGNGRFASELASKGCDVVALDINLTLTKAARQNTIENRSVHVILADMTNLPFSHHCFDKIICVHNLWYVPGYEKAIYEMRRVLRQGGILVADHLNLFDPAMYRRMAFYTILVLALAKKRIADIGRTSKALLRPFQGAKFQVWSVMTYDPLRITKGVRQFARRFVVCCTIE
jgi:ubiquinone/menaquinone biosynthesis C-methylase UbiE